MVDLLRTVTHEDYLVAVPRAVCEQYPTTAASLSQVQLVFGTGPRRRALDPLHRVWGGGEADAPLPLVEIAAIGGLAPAAVWGGLRNARWHQPRRGSRQPLSEGGVPASWLRLPGAGDAQVAAAGRAALPDGRPRQPDAGRKNSRGSEN